MLTDHREADASLLLFQNRFWNLNSLLPLCNLCSLCSSKIYIYILLHSCFKSDILVIRFVFLFICPCSVPKAFPRTFTTQKHYKGMNIKSVQQERELRFILKEGVVLMQDFYLSIYIVYCFLDNSCGTLSADTANWHF